MTFTIAALVLTNLLYVVVPVAVATVVSALYVLRHRKPVSVDSGIESFSRELRALAPDARPVAERRPGPIDGGASAASPAPGGPSG